MWAKAVCGVKIFYTRILEGCGLIAPLSNPDWTVTILAKHSISSSECMAGTTGLEPATSAVTESNY